MKRLTTYLISVFIICLSCLTIPVNAQQKESTNLFPIIVDGKWGYINNTGQIIIKPQFDDAFYFSEGLAPVQIDEKYGYIDKTGKIVITPQFFSAEDFFDGLAEVHALLGSGYIDRTGKYIWKPTD